MYIKIWDVSFFRPPSIILLYPSQIFSGEVELIGKFIKVELFLFECNDLNIPSQSSLGSLNDVAEAAKFLNWFACFANLVCLPRETREKSQCQFSLKNLLKIKSCSLLRKCSIIFLNVWMGRFSVNNLLFLRIVINITIGLRRLSFL